MREKARINADEDEVVIGPFTFEWEPNNKGVQVARGEEAVAYIEHVRTEQWEDFVYAALWGAQEGGST